METLYTQYKVYRQKQNATNAIARARGTIATGKRVFFGSSMKYPEYNPATDGVRWVENAANGLRLVGYGEYNEAYYAGKEYSDLGDEIKDHRKDAMELIHALRKERRANVPDIICKTLRDHVSSHLKDIAKLKDKRNKLLDDFSRAWRKEVHEAFNEGAEIKVIV